MSSTNLNPSAYANPSNYFRLVSPVATVDAHAAGVAITSANKTFNTNIPLNYYALITDIEWRVSAKAQSGVFGPNAGLTQILGQLTEALARTAVAGSDSVFVDTYEDELNLLQATAASIAWAYRPKAQFFHTLATPWATVAQQLNLIQSQNTLVGNGIVCDMQVIVGYSLNPVTPSISSYLSQRVQIAGQA